MAAFPQGGDGIALVTRIKDIMPDYVKNGIPGRARMASRQSCSISS